ncbi:MAG: hypothetical protein AABW73_04115 [Nanoarchaeota archaeon]
MISKRGGMTGPEIVGLVLAFLVLALLAWGFSIGFFSSFGNIFNLGGGKSTVSSVVTSCNAACNNNPNAFCNENKEFSFEDGVKQSATCEQLMQGKSFQVTIDGKQETKTVLGINNCFICKNAAFVPEVAACKGKAKNDICQYTAAGSSTLTSGACQEKEKVLTCISA